MSTFSGYLPEFPQIRIDNFRGQPGRPPPLACFLSHVHSDHLTGLESLKSPFVYCSSATREIILRLEKWPHRMNFQKGILEVRRQSYRHLARILKPLPVGRPITLELSPGNSIRVTLFDANHCVGAVMFLIENVSAQRAVLYTGDIRAERWWIDSIIRHPLLLPYTHAAGLRKLDNIYLDTTFAVKSSPYRRFPTKAEGIAELLHKIGRYPPQTVFYFRAWTFGYEDVWLALSSALDSPVHLDKYRHRLYSSVGKTRELGPGLECSEASVLCGFQVANDMHRGILSRDQNARLHSCERGSGCPVLLDLARGGRNVVDICPIISRNKGHDMHELGAGGGNGDLDRSHELELADPAVVRQLNHLLQQTIKDEGLLEEIQKLLRQGTQSDGRLSLSLRDGDVETTLMDEVKLPEVVQILRKVAGGNTPNDGINHNEVKTAQRITFPYSRHSSYEELRSLVSAFRPRDVYPCTAPTLDQWDESMSMEVLFGDLYSPNAAGYVWDNKMRVARERMDAVAREQQDVGVVADDSQKSEGISDDETPALEKSNVTEIKSGPLIHPLGGRPGHDVDVAQTGSETESEAEATPTTRPCRMEKTQRLSEIGKQRLRVRELAYAAAGNGTWASVALASVKRKLVDYEEEL